jgi:hypothetical protein
VVTFSIVALIRLDSFRRAVGLVLLLCFSLFGLEAAVVDIHDTTTPAMELVLPAEAQFEVSEIQVAYPATGSKPVPPSLRLAPPLRPPIG